jgi:hypothetical protein
LKGIKYFTENNCLNRGLCKFETIEDNTLSQKGKAVYDDNQHIFIFTYAKRAALKANKLIHSSKAY